MDDRVGRLTSRLSRRCLCMRLGRCRRTWGWRRPLLGRVFSAHARNCFSSDEQAMYAAKHGHQAEGNERRIQCQVQATVSHVMNFHLFAPPTPHILADLGRRGWLRSRNSSASLDRDRHLQATDPPVIAVGIVILAVPGVFYSEISGLWDQPQTPSRRSRPDRQQGTSVG
jgi:hypothetical protein